MGISKDLKGGLALAGVLSLCVALASGQCFTETNETQTSGPASTDLSGIADFSISLFKTLFPYREDRNMFFSPYSIWSALALAYFGARGDTEAQLRRTLRVGGKIETLKNWRALEYMYAVRQNSSEYIFRLANRAYFDQDVPLRTCVADILTSELKVVDMRQTQAVATEINDWVFNTTKGRISNLVSGADLANAHMVLANAAFFSGTWKFQFKKKNTKKELFYSGPSQYSFVEMMTQKGHFKQWTSEALGAHLLELPYTGEAVSMLVLLPPFITGDQGFDAMMGRLNASSLSEARNNLWSTEIEVKLPKFTLEETVGDELITALSTMGVSDLFTDRANLTAFAPSTLLSVGKSVHKAFVEVSEEGTEAAAATALISFRSARPAGPSKFVANHPFLFLIYDNDAGNVLFMGAYKSPKSRKQ